MAEDVLVMVKRHWKNCILPVRSMENVFDKVPNIGVLELDEIEGRETKKGKMINGNALK